MRKLLYFALSGSLNKISHLKFPPDLESFIIAFDFVPTERET
jgi:hypothetical protein